MLKLNMRNIYIDEDWAVQQYLNMERNKEWDEMETMNDETVARNRIMIIGNERLRKGGCWLLATSKNSESSRPRMLGTI
jgi:hypothetical protein